MKQKKKKMESQTSRYVTIKTAKYETYMGVDRSQKDPKQRLVMSEDVGDPEDYVWELMPEGSDFIFRTLSGFVLCFPDKRGHGDCTAIPYDYAIQTRSRIVNYPSNFTSKDENAHGGQAIQNRATGLILNITGGDSIGSGNVGAEPDDHTWTRHRSFKLVDAPIHQQVEIKSEMKNFTFEKNVIDLDPKNKPKETIVTLGEFEIKPDKVNVSQTISFSEAVGESFKWALTEKIGAGVKTSVSCGIPLLAEGKVEISASLEFGSSQETTTSQTRTLTWSTTVAFSSPGYYKVHGVLYQYDKIKCPFTAEITYTGTLKGKPVDANLLEKAIRNKGCAITKIQKDATSIKGEIRGFIEATSSLQGKVTVDKKD